jgi:C-terminal processing protease CtpA/Prc
VIDWFFPYRDLMDRDWGEALVEFIPRFEACRDEVEYQEAVFALAARLQDSHVYVENARAMEKRHGEFGPPIAVRSIEGRTVITALRDAGAKAFGLEVGDVILAVDDRPIDELRASLAPPIAASTPQALRPVVDAWMLRGAKESVAKLHLENTNGSIRDVAIPRSAPWASVAFEPGRTVPAVYQILPSGYAYVDLGRLPYDDADKAIDAMLGTPALIFDMRGYPNSTGMLIAARLAAADRTIVGTLCRIRLLSGNDVEKAWAAYDQTLSSTTRPRYCGKVVMLINEQAISAAEHTCLLFAAATDVTFIGSPTMGANGDVTKVVLPGDLTVRFTGLEVRHADGRQLQRVGVQPHVRVEPTIRGLREGRDEVLEAAVAYLQRTIGK